MLILCLLAVAVFDWQQRRIPNSLLCILLGAVMFNHMTAPQISGLQWSSNIALALLLTLPAYIKGVMGAGDVKIMLILAPVWPPFILLQVFSFGVLALIILMAMHQVLRKALAQQASRFQQTPLNSLTAKRTITGAFHRGLPLGTALFIGAVICELSIISL